MTGTLAYILARRIALGAVSGIKKLTFNGNQIVFHFNDGSTATMTIPLPKDGKDGVDGKDGADGKDGKDGKDGENGKDGVDGISIVDIKIDKSNHLICTLSDGKTIDAGKLPVGEGGSGGGLVTAENLAALPKPGEEGTLYLTLDNEILHYWNTKTNKYSPIAGGNTTPSADGIEFKSAQIEFDGVNHIFDLPIDNKGINVYVNGVYLTEGEDYTIDATVTPNTIEFVELWETTDLCTITWVNGKINDGSSGGVVDNASFATKEDIDNLFSNMPDIDPDDKDIYATKADIDKLFAGGGSTTPPTENSLATKQDIDNLFN